MPPQYKRLPSLKQIVISEIIAWRKLYGELYGQEDDLFGPVPPDIIQKLLDGYAELSDGVSANEVCMLITNTTSKLDLSKLRRHRNNIDQSLICDAVGTRCQSTLTELNLSRWLFPASSLAFITLLCGNLQVLDLSFTRATDAHIAVLAKYSHHLKVLNVQDEEQRITSKGLCTIADAPFKLQSLTITGSNFGSENVVKLLLQQSRLTHLRINNLIQALICCAQFDPLPDLQLGQLILLQVGVNFSHIPRGSPIDFSPVLSRVNGIEIDLTLFRQLCQRDSDTYFGLTKFTHVRELKIRETIGTPPTPDNDIVYLWNTILRLPNFSNLSFLQLESGLIGVRFPDLSCLENLGELVIRNSRVIFDANDVPKLPSKLSALVVSEIEQGLPYLHFKKMLDDLKFLDCLCLHFTSDADQIISSSEEWASVLEVSLPRLVKLHLSGNRDWRVDADFLAHIIQRSSRLSDLQLNHLKISPEERLKWVDYVSSTYELKFKLLE